MATSFEVIFLGTLPLIDTTQSNEVVESAAGILGSYGTSNTPLSGQVRTLSADRLTEDDNASYDLDNGGGYDSFRINGGAAQNFDAVAIYNATITYADGTTATITATVFQDINGNTYLAPEETSNADQAALTAKPIQSLTLTSVASNSGDMIADRVAGDFLSSVDGTAGNDTMNVGYTDAQGDQITIGNDFIVAGAGNDSVLAGGGADTVFGGTGNDNINAGDGNDSLFGGDDNDLISGGYGNDSINAGAGDDWVTDEFSGNTTLGGADTVDLGDGNDVFVGSGQNIGDSDLIYGGLGADTITVREAYDTVYGGDGNDSITTTDEEAIYGDAIYGDAGDDTITGANTDDTLFGGTGADRLFGEGNTDSLYGGDGADSLDGGSENDQLEGGLGDDTLVGGAGNDTLLGDDGNDTLNGGTGADSLTGGNGADIFIVQDGFGSDTITAGESTGHNDTIDLSALTSGVSATVNSEAGSITSGADSISFSQVENFTLTNQADTLSTQYSSGTILAGGGNDAVTTLGSSYVVDGGAGNDSITSTSGQVSLYGGIGDDLLSFGFNGRGLLDGGDGNDQLLASFSTDTIFGGAGNDTIRAGGGGADVLAGGSGADLFQVAPVGGTPGIGLGSVTIDGGEADAATDTLTFAGHTAAVIVTYTGNEAATFTDGVSSGQFAGVEALLMTAQNDVVNAAADSAGINADGGAGKDSLTGGAGGDTLSGGSGNDLLVGGAGADYADGGAEADSVGGGAGNDTLLGAAGDDTLAGGADNDVLAGGLGTDTAVFTGAVTDYSFDHNASGDLVVTDLLAARDGSDTLSGVEYAEFDGVRYHLVTGDDGSNTTLQGPGNGTPSLIIAHDGADWGGGHATSDVIFGGAGNDTLDGGDGNDTLLGEDDNDLLRGDAGNDQLFGGNGSDTLAGGAGNDTLATGAGSDVVVLVGNDGADRITDFDMTKVDGQTADQFDVSGMTNGNGDRITWRDVVVSDTNGDGTGDAVLTFGTGESVALEGVAPEAAAGKQNMAAMGIPCFCAGTPILTPSGWCAVEALNVGDRVTTTDGPRKVIWAGTRFVSAEDLDQHPDRRPVHFPAYAIGNTKAVRVSPQHGILMHDSFERQVLVKAKHLAEIGYGRARIAQGLRSVTYHHLMLEQHSIICAAGAPMESFYPGEQALAALEPSIQRLIEAAVLGEGTRRIRQDCMDLAVVYGKRAYNILHRKALVRLNQATFIVAAEEKFEGEATTSLQPWKTQTPMHLMGQRQKACRV